MRTDVHRLLPTRPRRGAVRFRAVAVVLGLVSLLAAGCTAAATPGPSVGDSPAVQASLPRPTATRTPVATFPLALTDDEGDTVTVPETPRAIVSLTPAATEIVYALGAGDRLVGKVEDIALYPPEAASVPDVAKFGSVDVERIVALKADLVIAGGSDFNPPADIAKLRSLGVPVLTVYGANLAGALTDIQLIGSAIGRPAEAADLTSGLRSAFDRIQSATRGLSQPRVYYELDATNGYFGPAPDYFGVEMIQLAGGNPLTSGTAGAFQIPEERIIAFDPEVILLGDAAYGVTAEQVAARPGWSGLSAVRDHAIRPVDDVIITRPGPRLAQGLAALAIAIHPGLALPSLPTTSVTAAPSVAGSPLPVVSPLPAAAATP